MKKSTRLKPMKRPARLAAADRVDLSGFRPLIARLVWQFFPVADEATLVVMYDEPGPQGENATSIQITALPACTLKRRPSVSVTRKALRALVDRLFPDRRSACVLMYQADECVAAVTICQRWALKRKRGRP